MSDEVVNPLAHRKLAAMTTRELQRFRNTAGTVVDRQATALELIRRGLPATPPTKDGE